MNGNGWIKVHRKTLDHEWLARDPVAKAAWLDILLAAEYHGAQAGRVNLSEREVPTRSCVSRETWRRMLRRFVAEGMLRIEETRGRGVRGGRGVDQYAWVTNYQRYQGSQPEVEKAETPFGAVMAPARGRDAHQRSPQPTRGATRGATRGRTREMPASMALAPQHESVANQRCNQTRSPSSRPKTLEEAQEERQGHEQTMRGASPIVSPPAERAHPSQELDLDQDPARPPVAPDAIDMDPRLHPEHALMDRMNGGTSARQEEIAARSFFVRLLGAANVRNPQVQPRMRAWHQQHGEAYIESVWREATTAQDPHNARKAPIYYFVDALDGKFLPRAAAARAAERKAARTQAPSGLEPGMLVALPNGEQHTLDGISGPWALLAGVDGVVPVTEVQPVLEVRP